MEFLIGTFVAIQLLAWVTAAMSEVAFLTVVRTEALGLRAFLLECGKYVLFGAWYGGGMETVGQLARIHEGLQTGFNVGYLARPPAWAPGLTAF